LVIFDPNLTFFKKLVLAGLRPEIIMEICSRALAFASYQSYQEKSHLESVCRKLDEKVQQQEKSLQQTIFQVNNEIACIFLLLF